jgi:hypothetical protein
MSKINDIFDLPEQIDSKSHETPKKERKKIVMTDEKKNALLERLAKGRETRANNLLAKKGLPPKTEEKTEGYKEPIKDKRVESLKKEDKSEEERKAFINTMMGKSKPVEKFERPKKKIITEGSDDQQKVQAEPKVLKVEAEPKVLKVEVPIKQNLVVAEPKVLKVETPKQNLVVERPKIVAPPKQSLVVIAPVVFSTLKKPMWG